MVNNMVRQKSLPTDEEYQMMDEEQKQQFIEDYYQGAFASSGFKPTFKQKIRRKLGGFASIIISLVVLAVIYGLINLVVVGAQEIWHSDQKSKMSQIKSELDQEQVTISDYEIHVNDGTISDSGYQDYKNLIDDYNKKVNEYNDLAQKAGTTWYVIPIPGGKH